jgi:hypothetical protein
VLLLLYCIPLVYTVVETRQRRGWSGNARVPHGQKNVPIRRSCKSEVLVTRTSSIMFWPATHFSYLPGLTTNKEGRHSYSALPRLRHMRRGCKHNACS